MQSVNQMTNVDPTVPEGVFSGTVKFYLQSDNYGFLRSEIGDVFFHRHQIEGDVRLREHDVVQFEMMVRKHKLCAKKVRLIQAGA
jgi:cold shock CspA family protein